MQVKISYSLPLDDVPEHISELLDNISDRLSKLSQDTNSTAKKVRSKQFSATTLVGTFGLLRDELAKIDNLLGDFSNIIVGYESAKLNPPESEDMPSEEQGAKEEEVEEVE
jgi:Mg2+ and Co2+ transporter CorA